LAVIAFDAFLDEAGTHAGAPVVTMAGFYGSKEQWALFRELWEPFSLDFHAKNSERLFPELCTAIEKSEINGIFVTIGKVAYKASATERVKSHLGNTYALCAFICAMKICDEVRTPISFVFEHGQPNLSFVQKVLLDMLNAGNSCIAAVTPAKKTDFIELHAADFISHCASAYEKPWLQRLIDSRRLKHAHIGKQHLEITGVELEELMRKARWERRKAKRANTNALD
jgi:hypothetical protein